MIKYTIPILLCSLLMFRIALANDWQEFERRGHQSPKWTPLVEAGFSAFESKNMDMAESFFQKAIGAGCKDGLVYFRMGLIYEEKGNLDKAKKYLELAKGTLPGRYPKHEATATIHDHLGRILFTAGDLSGAKAELEEAVRIAQPDFTRMFLLGSIARQENNYEKVLEYYNNALTLPPPQGTNPQDILITLLVEIGKAYYNLKQYDRSLATWDRILGIFPDHPIARMFKNRLERERMGGALKGNEERIIQEMIQ